jgi:hypothetical protein
MIQRRRVIQVMMSVISPATLVAAKDTASSPISVADILEKVRATLAKELTKPVPVWLHRGDSKWARQMTVEVRKALSEEGQVVWSESINVHFVAAAVGTVGGHVHGSETIYQPLPKYVLRIAEVGDRPMVGMRVVSGDPLVPDDSAWIWVLGG